MAALNIRYLTDMQKAALRLRATEEGTTVQQLAYDALAELALPYEKILLRLRAEQEDDEENSRILRDS